MSGVAVSQKSCMSNRYFPKWYLTAAPANTPSEKLENGQAETPESAPLRLKHQQGKEREARKNKHVPFGTTGSQV